MSFTAIGAAEVVSGKPVSTTVVGKVKDNFDDHEARLQVIESGTAVTYPPLILRVGGPYSIPGAMSAILKTTTNFPIKVTGIRLLIDQAGSSGTTEVDVKFKRGSAAYQSILTTKPSVPSSAGNDALSGVAAGSTAGVLNPSYVNLQAGDILQLDTTSVQSGGIGFLVRIDYSGA